MSRPVYKNHNYIIFRAVKGYIVYNTDKPFKCGHTHVKNFYTAKHLIWLSRNKVIPKRLSFYLWVSLERISTGKTYCKQLRNIITDMAMSRGQH